MSLPTCSSPSRHLIHPFWIFLFGLSLLVSCSDNGSSNSAGKRGTNSSRAGSQTMDDHRVPSGFNDVEQAMFRGCHWLSLHQSDSGAWRGAEFPQHCPADDACDGTGFATHDGALTALAVLAMMETEVAKTNQLLRAQRNALSWLNDHVDMEDGTIRFQQESKTYFARSLALLALFRAGNRKELGIDIPQEKMKQIKTSISTFIKNIKIKKAADRLPECATPWFWLVLKSKPHASPTLPQPALRKLMNIVSHSFDSGWVSTEAITGIQKYFYLDNSSSGSGMNVIGDYPDAIRVRPESDLYATFFWLKALQQTRGDQARSEMLNIQARILDEQITYDHQKGSWTPSGQWGSEGGRIYSTAMALLILASTPNR